MAVDLSKQAKQVDFDDGSYDDLLDNLQANVLRSHGRDYTRHVFLKFTAPPAAVRAWIRDKVAREVTSAREQLNQIKDKRDAEARGEKHDGGPVLLFFLSAAGYDYLGFDVSRFGGRAFAKGMKDRRDYVASRKVLGVFKIKEPNRDPPPSQWEAGFQQEIHALLILGDDGAIVPGTEQRDETRLLNELNRLRLDYRAVALEAQVDEGRVLRRRLPQPDDAKFNEPIEHFGYFDGISQPLFSHEEIGHYEQKFHRPLQGGDWDPGASLDLVLVRDPFASEPDAYGSFFVYRKLAQDYDLFRAREAALKQATGLPGEQAGAMAVGRFEDGTPIALHPERTPDNVVDNCFSFTVDPKGSKCPRHAHIRKVNPRGTTPGHTPEQERARRIARRGIPYGRPVAALNLKDEPTAPSSAPRGLLFMCYQAEIDEQFEFIQRIWVDNRNFPKGSLPVLGSLFGILKKTGDDPLIGQQPGARQRWPRVWGAADGERMKLSFDSAVTLKGGEYFFTPSLPFLRKL